MTDPTISPAVVSTLIRVRIFERPGEEISGLLEHPWPTWVKRLYELERLAAVEERDPYDPSLSAVLTAMSGHLHHRLALLAWAVAALEEDGWEVVVEDDDVVATKLVHPEMARDQLEEAGIYGALTNLCEIDEHGHPVLHG